MGGGSAALCVAIWVAICVARKHDALSLLPVRGTKALSLLPVWGTKALSVLPVWGTKALSLLSAA